MDPHERTTHLPAADGTVRDWLVSPAWATPCDDLEEFLVAEGLPWGEDGRWVLTNGPDVGPLKERILAPRMRTDVPLPAIVEGGDVDWIHADQPCSGAWRRVHTGWDGLVDWSEFCHTPRYRASIAATVIEVDQSEWRTLEVASTGPFVCWVGGVEVLRSRRVSYMEPEVQRVRLRLPSGTTTVHIATWQVALRECRQIVRLRIEGLPVRVVIPSPGADETVARWGEQLLEQISSTAWAIDGDVATLRAPAGLRLRVRTDFGGWLPTRVGDDGLLHCQLQAPDHGTLLKGVEHVIEVRLDDDRSPVTRELRVARLPLAAEARTDGNPELWRHEVLAHVGTHAGIAGALVRHAREGARIGPDDVATSLELVDARGDCADFEALALLSAWHHVPADGWEPGVRDRVRASLLGLKYWITQPGLDAMCYFTENHQFVWHVAEHLVGSTFPDETLGVDGRSGRDHAVEAAKLAAAWIGRKLRGGFSEFDSNAYLAIDSYALVTLVELAEDERLRHAARTLLDKVLFMLAANSWHGVHGAAHGRSYVHTLRSARFEETSPILRLICGLGSLNEALLPVTALALARRYEIPELVRRVAARQPDQWWGRQVTLGRLAFERDLLDRPYRSDVRVWRTPDVMLSSVTDYRAGLPGLQEHIWGATLGPECQIFLTHPANADRGSSARPNSWAGHRVLPRVHQHREALVGLQRATPSDPMGPHLWWPSEQFDEEVVRGDWLIGRRGRGHVAVATPGGFAADARGDTAGQEWWPRGDGSRWVVCVGGDGPFDEFVDAVLASELDWAPHGPRELAVRWRTPSGTLLELGFDRAFLVDGVAEDLVDGGFSAPAHLDNPAVTWAFDAEQVTARWEGETLDFDVAGALAAAEEVEHGR